MKKRIAKVMLLSVVLPGGAHAAEMKSNSHSSHSKGQDKVAFAQTTPLVSKKTILKQGKKAEPADEAVDMAKTELVSNQAEQDKQDGVAANSAESAEPPFHVKGVRG